MSDFNHVSRWGSPDDDKLPEDVMELCTQAAEMRFLVDGKRLTDDSAFAYGTLRQAAQAFQEQAVLACQAYALNNHAVSISPVDAVHAAIEREVFRLKAEHPKQPKSGNRPENGYGSDLVPWDESAILVSPARDLI